MRQWSSVLTAMIVLAAALAQVSCSENDAVILPREAWDARDPLQDCEMWMYREAVPDVYRRIIIHHSAFPAQTGPGEIQRHQMEAMGYCDIAYHFIIDSKGRIFRGRDLGTMGAHAGNNRKADSLAQAMRAGNITGIIEDALRLDPDWGSAGICLCGNFTVGSPTEDQIRSLHFLVLTLKDSLKISVDSVLMHRQVNSGTLCPGYLDPYLDF